MTALLYRGMVDEDQRLHGLVNRVEVDQAHAGQLGALLRVHPLDLQERN